MKAAVYTHYGPPEVLRLQEVAPPVPGDHEIRIKVHATTVAVADARVRSFDVPWTIWLPARLALGLVRPRKNILGAEVSGEVESVGQAVTRFKPGDRVYASTLPDFGGYAEYTCLPADGPVALKPSSLTFQEAAALPVGAHTALHYLRRANIRPGQRVLVYGASGSVGTYAVQLAKHFGAEVTGVCSTSNLEMVTSLGADRVIDYTVDDFASHGAVYDVVLDAVDKSDFADCLRVLKPGGVYLNVANPLPSRAMLWARLSGRAKLVLGESPPRTPAGLEFLNALVEEGVLKPVIDQTYDLDDLVAAHRYVDKGHKKGNVVITINPR